ncbi:hypothetical protein BpHYR1_041249 [Brachionus plicatilis]|uniref:Uncharacterized protein n=1 Tax=Brachionus plicatilis TaxID=10195 RepID=A0A3M7PYV1_BRAPC|nr:hypothetical protein BpHYR1_041249 [Brachionus plicatilis]
MLINFVCCLARDASSLASSDKTALTDQASSENMPATDNGVWLIVIVFGYIFGLFLIFVVIWFIWYGTSIKRDRRSSSSSSQNNLNPGSAANSNHFSSYSASSSLSRHGGKEIINGYSPAHNMAFNNRDEYFQKSNLLTQDDLSGSHSTSFVHSYHHRI